MLANLMNQHAKKFGKIAKSLCKKNAAEREKNN